MEWEKNFNQALKSQNNIQKCLEYLTECLILDPTRLEVHILFAKMFRILNQLKLSYFHLQKVFDVSKYSGELEEILNTEMSIIAYYNDDKRNGMKACENIMLSNDINNNLRFNTHKNQLFYMKCLNPKKIKFNIELPSIQNLKSDALYHNFRPLNPCIINNPYDNGYILLCRTVNFVNQNCLSYTSLSSDNIIRTRNFLLYLDENFQTISQHEIIENIERPRYEKQVTGMEDCRLFYFQNRLWVLCTVYDTIPEYSPKIALCRLSSNLDENQNYHIDHFIQLQGPDKLRCEKNWMPIVEKHQTLKIIYNYSPLIIYEPNIKTGECDIIAEKYNEINLSHLRGSSPPILYKQSLLMLTHEVVMVNNIRNYRHRFLKLDMQYNIEKVSEPFSFYNENIEYSCGMCIKDNKLLIGLGIKDCEALIAELDLKIVDSLLN